LNGRSLAAVSDAWLDPSKSTSLSSSTTGGREWDQFETNKRLFDVKSTYDENLYTKKLDYSVLTAEQIAKADRIAKEIEKSTSANIHLLEERGQLAEREIDEEALYSGVVRDDYKPATFAGSSNGSTPSGSGKYSNRVSGGGSAVKEEKWERGKFVDNKGNKGASNARSEQTTTTPQQTVPLTSPSSFHGSLPLGGAPGLIPAGGVGSSTSPANAASASGNRGFSPLEPLRFGTLNAPGSAGEGGGGLSTQLSTSSLHSLEGAGGAPSLTAGGKVSSSTTPSYRPSPSNISGSNVDSNATVAGSFSSLTLDEKPIPPLISASLTVGGGSNSDLSALTNPFFGSGAGAGGGGSDSLYGASTPASVSSSVMKTPVKDDNSPSTAVSSITPTASAAGGAAAADKSTLKLNAFAKEWKPTFSVPPASVVSSPPVVPTTTTPSFTPVSTTVPTSAGSIMNPYSQPASLGMMTATGSSIPLIPPPAIPSSVPSMVTAPVHPPPPVPSTVPGYESPSVAKMNASAANSGGIKNSPALGPMSSSASATLTSTPIMSNSPSMNMAGAGGGGGGGGVGTNTPTMPPTLNMPANAYASPYGQPAMDPAAVAYYQQQQLAYAQMYQQQQQAAMYGGGGVAGGGPGGVNPAPYGYDAYGYPINPQQAAAYAQYYQSNPSAYQAALQAAAMQQQLAAQQQQQQMPQVPPTAIPYPVNGGFWAFDPSTMQWTAGQGPPQQPMPTATSSPANAAMYMSPPQQGMPSQMMNAGQGGYPQQPYNYAAMMGGGVGGGMMNAGGMGGGGGNMGTPQHGGRNMRSGSGGGSGNRDNRNRQNNAGGVSGGGGGGMRRNYNNYNNNNNDAPSPRSMNNSSSSFSYVDVNNEMMGAGSAEVGNEHQQTTGGENDQSHSHGSGDEEGVNASS
jgi:hypothetical protein